jgi:hypothetical protein
MSTLTLHAPSVPKLLALPSLAIARAIAAARTVLDTYAEAQRQVAEAERRYPFMAW